MVDRTENRKKYVLAAIFLIVSLVTFVVFFLKKNWAVNLARILG